MGFCHKKMKYGQVKPEFLVKTILPGNDGRRQRRRHTVGW